MIHLSLDDDPFVTLLGQQMTEVIPHQLDLQATGTTADSVPLV